MLLDCYRKVRYHVRVKKGIDYIGVGAGAIIFGPGGKVFLAKRGKDARNERHKWEFPGGSVEFGETIKEALQREITEEFGFTIDILQLLDVVDHILPREKQHWISPTYLCRYKSGKPSIREPRKCEEIGWFNLDDLPVDHLSSASRQSLENLLRYLNGS